MQFVLESIASSFPVHAVFLLHASCNKFHENLVFNLFSDILSKFLKITQKNRDKIFISDYINIHLLNS